MFSVRQEATLSILCRKVPTMNGYCHPLQMFANTFQLCIAIFMLLITMFMQYFATINFHAVM
jgi:hypothetical protein